MRLENNYNRIQSIFTEIFGLGRAASIAAVIAISIIIVAAVFWFLYLAPPSTITITSGPEGSVFYTTAQRYAKILARNGVTVKIVQSEGSFENLKRLVDPKFRVDIGFVQGGVADGVDISSLVSLGSVSYQPLLIFYRGSRPLDLLSQLKGKRLAIGPEGSGVRLLSLKLLEENGIRPGGSTTLLNMDPDDAAEALPHGKMDAVFLMGESASLENIRKLRQTPGIRILSFTQADAYVRRITYLSRLELPMGSIDFGNNVPARDIHLVGPTVEIIAHEGLHPAISDLLLEAAREVHGRAGLFKKQGEFPAPMEHEFRISPDALRFYKSGRSFLYRYLPFWLASFANRILVVFLPTVVVLIPVLRVMPTVYRWRIMMRIYRWYRSLLSLERGVIAQMSPEKRDESLRRLDEIEREVNKMKVPASFADQFYVLRGHIGFVRERLMKSAGKG